MYIDLYVRDSHKVYLSILLLCVLSVLLAKSLNPMGEGLCIKYTSHSDTQLT